MALTHTTAVRNILADAIDTAAVVGTTNATARLVFMTSGDVEVATLAMDSPPFGAASSGAITAGTISDDVSATGGTVALFKITDRDNTEIYRGTVTTSGGGGDIILSTLTVGASDTVSVSSLVYTASA